MTIDGKLPQWMLRALAYEASPEGQMLASTNPDAISPREWLADYLRRRGYSEDAVRESLTSADYATRRAGNAPDGRWPGAFQKHRLAWVAAHGEDGYRVPAIMVSA